MRRCLYGSLLPGLEVLLVVIGLSVLGWEGLVYAWTDQWHAIPLATPLSTIWSVLGLGHLPDSGFEGWLLQLPVAGTCMVAGVVMFFILPPAYAHAE